MGEETKVKRYNIVQRWLGHDHAVLEREYVDHGESVDASDYLALAARLRECERDAERYRFLRNDCNGIDWRISQPSMGTFMGEPHEFTCTVSYFSFGGSDFDKAIDAASREKQT